MKRCRKCGFVSPVGSRLCGGCGRSFRGRLCPANHRSPADVEFCVYCGSSDLTEYTASFPLGWMSQLLVLGIGVLLVRWLWHHTAEAISLAWWGFVTLIAIVIGCAPQEVHESIMSLCASALVVTLLLLVFPGRQGQVFRAQARSIIVQVFRSTANMVISIVVSRISALTRARRRPSEQA